MVQRGSPARALDKVLPGRRLSAARAAGSRVSPAAGQLDDLSRLAGGDQVEDDADDVLGRDQRVRAAPARRPAASSHCATARSSPIQPGTTAITRARRRVTGSARAVVSRTSPALAAAYSGEP